MEANNNNNFVNFFTEEKLNDIRNACGDNFTNQMNDLSDQQKSNLLNFIFNIQEPVPTGSLSPNDVLNQLKKLQNTLKTFETMKVPELQDFCKDHGIKSTGSKRDLIRRIQLSVINFNQFNNDFIQNFENWADLCIIGWTTEIDEIDMIDEPLLSFITRIIKSKKLFFADILEKTKIAYNTHFEPKTAVLAWILSFNCILDNETANERSENILEYARKLQDDPETKRKFIDLLHNSLNIKQFLKWASDKITIGPIENSRHGQFITNFKPRLGKEGLLNYLDRILDYVNYFEEDTCVLKRQNRCFTPRELADYYLEETTN